MIYKQKKYFVNFMIEEIILNYVNIMSDYAYGTFLVWILFSNILQYVALFLTVLHNTLGLI